MVTPRKAEMRSWSPRSQASTSLTAIRKNIPGAGLGNHNVLNRKLPDCRNEPFGGGRICLFFHKYPLAGYHNTSITPLEWLHQPAPQPRRKLRRFLKSSIICLRKGLIGQHFQGEYEELLCRQDSSHFEVTARFPEYPSLVSLQFLRKKGSARGPHQGLCLHPVIGRLSGC